MIKPLHVKCHGEIREASRCEGGGEWALRFTEYQPGSMLTEYLKLLFELGIFTLILQMERTPYTVRGKIAHSSAVLSTPIGLSSHSSRHLVNAYYAPGSGIGSLPI